MYARKTTTPEAKRLRSIDLAIAAQMGAHSARCVDVHVSPSGELLAVTVTIASRTNRDELHSVTYDARHDSATCDCTAATYGNACCHAGATILYGRVAADCYKPAAIRAARREQFLADNDNAY